MVSEGGAPRCLGWPVPSPVSRVETWDQLLGGILEIVRGEWGRGGEEGGGCVCNLSGDMSQAQLHHPPPTPQAEAEDGTTDG